MTVTRDQAQMLTSLALALRPYRAPTWDAPGVMAAIGKIREWSLADVMLHVAVAASDREALTPAVIGTQRIPELKPGPWQPDSADPHERCSTCDLRPGDCRTRWAGDHEYAPRHQRPTGIDIPRVVDHLRDELVTAKAAPQVDTANCLSEREPNPHAEAARKALRDRDYPPEEATA